MVVYMSIFIIGFLTSVAMAIIMMKIGLHHFLKFGWQVDLLLSGLAAFIFAGTFSGMASGIIAGIFISIFLTVMRKFS